MAQKMTEADSSGIVSRLSGRQREVLETMGVDLWQLRQPSCHLDTVPTTQPNTTEINKGQRSVDALAVSVAMGTDSEIDQQAHPHNRADTIDSGEWLVASDGNPDSDCWFVCDCGARSDPNVLNGPNPQAKLLHAICTAVGVSADEIMTVSLQSNVASPSSPESHLKQILADRQPANIMLFGERAARALLGTDKNLTMLRQEQYRLSAGNTILGVTYDLYHLLQHPENKRKVWQDICRMLH